MLEFQHGSQDFRRPAQFCAELLDWASRHANLRPKATMQDESRVTFDGPRPRAGARVLRVELLGRMAVD